MLALKKISPTKLWLYGGLLLAVLLAVGFLSYRYFWPQIKTAPPALTESAALPVLSPRVEVDFKAGILSNPLFANLKMRGDLPVKAGELGRTNPFQEF